MGRMKWQQLDGQIITLSTYYLNQPGYYDFCWMEPYGNGKFQRRWS